MDTVTITVGTINTKPLHDPYVNIAGIVSRTYLKLDPRDRTVWVEQEYRTNSTAYNEWLGLVLTWRVPGHPSEADMLDWIESSMLQLTAICDGFEQVWDGHNHVGHLNEDARSNSEAIEWELDNDGGPVSYYETWTVDSWLEMSMGEITADMTDEQLREWASGAEPDNATIVLGDILEYITQHRDNLKWEAELDKE